MPFGFTLILLLYVGFCLALGVAYRFLIQPGVCYHFGEEFRSRRGSEATRRRRAFERHCVRVAFSLMVAGAINGVGQGNIHLPELVTLGGPIALLLVAGLFVWAAISRWRTPFED